jgi:hypothetical protein
MCAEETVPLRVIAGDAHERFGIAVVGLQVLVADRPVDADAVLALHAEIAREEPRDVAEEVPRGAADAAEIRAGEFRRGPELVVLRIRFGMGRESVARASFVRRAGRALQRARECAHEVHALRTGLACLEQQYARIRAGEVPGRDAPTTPDPMTITS